MVRRRIILGYSYLINIQLLAAHCFHDKYSSPTPDDNVYAILGRFDLLNNAEIGSVRRDVARSILHPDWQPISASFDGDIAIILLNLEITFNDLIQPICMPTSTTNAINVKGIVAGYGLTSNSTNHETKPRYTEISSIDHGTCLYTDPNLAFVGSLR